MDLGYYSFDIGANLDSADVGDLDIEARRCTANARSDVTRFGVH